MEQQTQQLTTVSPNELISQAIDKGLTVEALEKLMGLQERWDANQSRKMFFEAFTRFQSECPDLRKTKEVKFGNTSYKYAPLADIARQINEPLKNCDLSYRWEIQDDEKTIVVTCLVSHVHGHTEKTQMTASPDTSGSKNPIQARGSAIEYLKRYTLIGSLGLTTADEDIDGRLPDVDIDDLHTKYMKIYSEIIQLDKTLTKMDPDNWKTGRTAKLYVKATAEARKVLAELKDKSK